MITLPYHFRLAKLASTNSKMNPKVGAVLVVGNSFQKGFNKNKTHPKYANPEIHDRISIHAELDCLSKVNTAEGGEIYVYRELNGIPAMARPCNHCLGFLREEGISRIFYTTPHKPYWEMEELC